MSLTAININDTEYKAYTAVAEADTYLQVDLTRRIAWKALSEEEKGIYLVAATHRLDSLPWLGQKASENQQTEWPRSGMIYRDDSVIPVDTIPLAIEQATILLAGNGAVSPEIYAADVLDTDIQSERIGPKAITYFHRRQKKGVAQLIPDLLALSLIREWIASELVAKPVITGTDSKSAFVPEDKYGRTVA